MTTTFASFTTGRARPKSTPCAWRATLCARLCATALAGAHARWGDRVAIASYLGRGRAFDVALGNFSSRYADQNERDYEALTRAVKSGRLPAETGV
ncbi:MAG TPA: DUF2252 family protein [Streptosporangiaceae bacterium]|nr:DUF2252 family protein [Streptosporangiaceae bacterium]